MKTLCIYHSRDLDGWMSAAIVKKHNQDYNRSIGKSDKFKDDNLDFLGWDYGNDIPDTSKYDKVIMCDVSFPKGNMLTINLQLGENFVWIDHHQRSIDEVNAHIIEYGQPMEGLVTQKGELKAACELTWEYFYPNDEMPEIVRLLGRYDCFGHKGTDEEQKVLEFQYAARAIIGDYKDAYTRLINWIPDYLDYWLDKGKAVYKYLCTEAKQTYAKAFEVKFIESVSTKIAGHIEVDIDRKFLCVNQERFNPINFGIDYHKDGYDGFACFWLKDGKWMFSLYNDNGKVDCSAIAKSFGGGGHKGAAGFVIEDIEKLELILEL